MLLRITVKPNSRKNQISRMPDGSLVVKIAAPPQEGQANEALIRFLSEVFDIPKSAIGLKKGHTARFKQVEINADEQKINEVLGRFK